MVAMDSLIHYERCDIARVLAGLASRVSGPMLITIAPKTPLLTTLHFAGRLFPRSDRAPAIVPVSARSLGVAMRAHPALEARPIAERHRISASFYISEALRIAEAGASERRAA